MKKEYLAPQTDVVFVLMESMMNTDSDGLDDDFCAKNQGDAFLDTDDDNDLWSTESKDLWGDW